MAVLSPSPGDLGLRGAGVMGRSLSSDGNNMVFGVTSGRRIGLGAIFLSGGVAASVVAQLYSYSQTKQYDPQTRMRRDPDGIIRHY